MLVTDAPFHCAGEGWQADLLNPNNLDNVTDVYEDYPSIGQLKGLLEQYNVIPIFAIVNNVVPNYLYLAAALGRGVVQQNSFDSSTIVSAVVTALAQISGTVILGVNTDPLSLVQTIIPGAGYNGIAIGTEVTFNVTLLALPADAGTTTEIILSLTGLPNSPVVITATVQYCDQCANISANVSYCTTCRSNGATCNCGSCDCGEFTSGADCGCNLLTGCQDSNCPEATGRAVCSDCNCLCQPGFSTVDENEPCGCQTFCIPPCLNGGTCACNGSCVCDDNYCGAQCDCVCNDCSAHDNCNGHGTCVACNCECDDGWTGPNCDICSANCDLDVCSPIPNCLTCVNTATCLWCQASPISKCVREIYSNTTCIEIGSTLLNESSECPKNSNLTPAALGGIVAGSTLAGIIVAALLYKFVQVQRDVIEWKALEKDVRSNMSSMQQSSLYEGNTKEQYSQLYQQHEAGKSL